MPAVGVTSLMTTGKPCSAPSLSPRITAASASLAKVRAASATRVTMALSFGLTRAIVARWASSTSTGLTALVAISDASSTAVLRLRFSAMSDFPLLARPMHEATLDREEQEIEAIAERACGKDRGIHIGHVEQLLRLEHTLAESIGRTDEHLGDDDDHQRQRNTIAQPDECLRQRFQQHHIPEHPDAGCTHHTRGKNSRLARVHHAIGDVEQDHQRRAKGGDRYLCAITDAEQHQKQWEHR